MKIARKRFLGIRQLPHILATISNFDHYYHELTQKNLGNITLSVIEKRICSASVLNEQSELMLFNK